MSHSPMELTEDRVDRLEQAVERLSRELDRSRFSNLIWRASTALAVLAAVALSILPAIGLLKMPLLFDAEAKGAVSSKGYTLFNRESRKTVILDNDKYGAPNMAFIDSKGNYRVDLKIDGNDVAALNFYDTHGKRGRFSVVNNAEAVLEVTGAEGKGGMVVRVGADGSPRLTLTDATGETLFQAPPDKP